MTVVCPAPEWPGSLVEDGPPEDRSILLRGEATIGGVRFSLTAMRMDPIRFGPDLRPEHGSSVYAAYSLSDMLDKLSDVMDVAEAATLQLSTGSYLLWMLPGNGAG